MSTILVLDDQAANRQFLATLLGYLGHDVLEAGDAESALETVGAKRPDLVIVDVILPGMNGFEFARRLRGKPKVAATPLIFFTSGDDDAKTVAEAKACGARHLLRKPADPETIIRAVSDVVGKPSGGAAAQAVAAMDRELGERAAPLDPRSMVYVVDDDPSQRQHAVSILKQAGVPVTAFEGAQRFLDEFKRDTTSCLVVDLKMPGMTGLELLERLRAEQLEMPAIVLTGHGDIPAAVHSMKLGVLDFLEKPVNPRILVAKVHEGLAKDAELRKQRGETDAVRQRFADLTPREHELLQLLIAGRSNKQVAADLGISIKTVAHHRSHLMAKTQALNAADLVRLSLIAGIGKAPAET